MTSKSYFPRPDSTFWILAFLFCPCTPSEKCSALRTLRTLLPFTRWREAVWCFVSWNLSSTYPFSWSADATGLGFVCFVVINPRLLLANKVDLGSFFLFRNLLPTVLKLQLSFPFFLLTPCRHSLKSVHSPAVLRLTSGSLLTLLKWEVVY